MTDQSKSTFSRISYTPIEAAAATGRTRTRIYLAIKSGELTARKDGRATLIEHSELQRWVQSFQKIDPVQSAEESGKSVGSSGAA
jgi:excisionase family DNA binding protein